MAQITRKKLASIAGTRPQFIKHSILAGELSGPFSVQLLYTGQHFDQSLYQNIFSDLKLSPPDKEFSGNNDLVIKELQHYIQKEDFDAVIVYGDTNSTLWGAKAASIAGIPLIHIEAGERSFNPGMPEEYNRIETDRLSNIRCCVSPKSITQLEQEGLLQDNFLTGDIMKDLLLKNLPTLKKPEIEVPFYFASLHRNYTREDGDSFRNILQSLDELDHLVVFSLHPSTRISMNDLGILTSDYKNILFIDPVNYTNSLGYQFFSQAVLTDSGGIQREAYWMKKRCVTLRKETEWTETLEGNWNSLYYGVTDLGELLKKPLGPWNSQLYGQGKACQLISDIITRKL